MNRIVVTAEEVQPGLWYWYGTWNGTQIAQGRIDRKTPTGADIRVWPNGTPAMWLKTDKKVLMTHGDKRRQKFVDESRAVKVKTHEAHDMSYILLQIKDELFEIAQGVYQSVAGNSDYDQKG